MSERKEVWYWIKVTTNSEWEPMSYTELYDSDIDVIGSRIPNPDEAWVCVPKEPSLMMAVEYARGAVGEGQYLSTTGYDAMLATAPSLEDV